MALFAPVEAATELSMRRAGSKDAPSLLNVLIRTLDKKEFSLQVRAQACERLPHTSSPLRRGAARLGRLARGRAAAGVKTGAIHPAQQKTER